MDFGTKYTDDELHEMLDLLIARGDAWLAAMHFPVWLNYQRKAVPRAQPPRPTEVTPSRPLRPASRRSRNQSPDD